MSFQVEEIRREFDDDICHIIKTVGAEHGAVGEGFGPSDPEVSAMSRHYSDRSKSLYLVALVDKKVIGGCGVASFRGEEICELRKLFLLPESRGLGAGKELTIRCLEYAKSKGYKQCYLDTLSNMKPAIALYESLGFKHLDAPLDGTIHNGCDVWMLKDL